MPGAASDHEEGPFAPLTSRWKDLGRGYRLKHRSADWESLRKGVHGQSTLPKLPSLAPPSPHGHTTQQPLSTSLQALPPTQQPSISLFAEKYKRFIPQENLEFALAAAKAVERAVTLPPLEAEPLDASDTERRKEFDAKMAQLPLRRPFEDRKHDEEEAKRQRLSDSTSARRSSTGVLRTGRGKGKVTEDDRMLHYVLGPPLEKALLELAAFEAKTVSTQGLVRVEATEVEFEECLELASEQERRRLEQLLAEQEQHKHEQRLAELSREKRDSLTDGLSARSATPRELATPLLAAHLPAIQATLYEPNTTVFSSAAAASTPSPPPTRGSSQPQQQTQQQTQPTATNHLNSLSTHSLPIEQASGHSHDVHTSALPHQPATATTDQQGATNPSHSHSTDAQVTAHGGNEGTAGPNHNSSHSSGGASARTHAASAENGDGGDSSAEARQGCAHTPPAEESHRPPVIRRSVTDSSMGQAQLSVLGEVRRSHALGPFALPLRPSERSEEPAGLAEKSSLNTLAVVEQEAGDAVPDTGSTAPERMQSFLKRSLTFVGPFRAQRRASFGGTLLGTDAHMDQNSEEPVPRARHHSQSGIDAVLQPKLNRIPSIAACRRLSKRHTWFGVEDESPGHAGGGLLEGVANEDNEVSRRSSESSFGLLPTQTHPHTNRTRTSEQEPPPDSTRSRGEHEPRHSNDEQGTTQAAPQAQQPPPDSHRHKAFTEEWPRLKPRVSVIASVLAAGAALGVPSLMDCPSGPPDVAAVAFVWAAWAREPANTKSHLVVPAHCESAEEHGKDLSPRTSLTMLQSGSHKQDSITPKPFIQKPSPAGESQLKPTVSLALPPSHYLLQELLQPHPRRSPRLCGVSLSFLLTLGGLLVAELGPQEAWRLTTQDVTEWLLQPVAQPRRCSVAELLPDEAVGVPQYMVSHRYGSPFLSTVTALANHFSTANVTETFLWVDFLSYNSYGFQAKNPSKQASIVRDVVRGTQHTLLILDAEGRALSRTWVLFEAWCSCLPAIPDVTENPQSTEPAAPVTPGAPKLVVLLAHGGLGNPMLAHALAGASTSASESSSAMEHEALLDHMRKVSISLTSHRARLELAELPEYKRQAKDYFQKSSQSSDPNSPFSLEALDPLVQADRLIQQSLLQSVQSEAHKCTQLLDTTPASPPQQLAAAIRRVCQLGILMVAFKRPAELLHLHSRAVITAIESPTSDLCIPDIVCAATLLVHALICKGRVRNAVLCARKLYEAMGKVMLQHPSTATAALSLWAALTKGLQHPSAERVARSTLKRLQEIHARLHPHLNHLHELGSRPASRASSTVESMGTPRQEDSHRPSRFGSLRERLMSHSGSGKEPPPLQACHSISSWLSHVSESSRQVAATEAAEQAYDKHVTDASFSAITTPGGILWWWGHHGWVSPVWGERETDKGGHLAAKPEDTNGTLNVGETDDGLRLIVRVDVAHTAWAYGSSLHAQKRWDEAEKALVHSALYLQSALGPRHPFLGLILLALGEVAASKRDHLEAASCFMQARPLILSGYTRDSEAWIHVTIALASSLHALGDLGTAERMMRRLLRPPVSVRRLGNMPTGSPSSSPSPEPGSAPQLKQQQQQQQQQQQAESTGSEERRTKEGGESNSDEEQDEMQSTRVKEWLLNEDETALDARLSGLSFQVLCQLAKILSSQSVHQNFCDPNERVKGMTRHRLLGTGDVAWDSAEKAYIRPQKAGLSLAEAQAEVRAAMDKRQKGLHTELPKEDEDEDIPELSGPPKPPSTAEPPRRGVSFAGYQMGDSADVPGPSKGSGSIRFRSLEMQSPLSNHPFELPPSDADRVMQEATGISAKLLKRLQEAIKSSRQLAEASAVARLRAQQGKTDESAVQTRRQLKGQKTMEAEDYAARLRGVQLPKSGSSKAGGVGWGLAVRERRMSMARSGSRRMSRRGSVAGDARRMSRVGDASTDDESASGSLGPLSSRKKEGKHTGSQPPPLPQLPEQQQAAAAVPSALPSALPPLTRHKQMQQQQQELQGQQQRQSEARRVRSQMLKAGTLKGNVKVHAAAVLEQREKERSRTTSGSPLPPLEKHGTESPPRSPKRHARPRPSLSNQPHNARHDKPRQSTHQGEERRKVHLQDDTKAVEDVPAVIATAAGLAAESAEREAWKLAALQLADLLMEHARELHLHAELPASIMAAQAGTSIYASLGGPGSGEYMNAVVHQVDVFMGNRQFIEAHQLVVSHDESVNNSVADKVAIRHLVEQKTTDHLFRAANLGDEELAFWALELGAKIFKPVAHATPEGPFCTSSLLLPMASALAVSVSHSFIGVSAVIVAMSPQAVEEPDGVTGVHPLSMAAALGHPGLVSLILDSKAHVDAQDREGKTALMHAAANGHDVVISTILSKSHPSLNMKESRNGMTALMLAAAAGHQKAVWVLLEGMAGTGMLDTHGRTALIWAAIGGHHEVLHSLLLKGGSRHNAKDEEGMTALSHACLGGHLKCVQLLLEQKADLRITDNQKHTPLHKAAMVENPEVLSLLLMERPEVGLRDVQGRNTLHLAAGHNNSLHCAMLIFYVARCAEMSMGNNKPLVPMPHLQLNFGGNIKGINAKIGSTVDNILKGKQQDARRTGGNPRPPSVLLPIALYESSRLKQADDAYEAARAKQVRHMQKMQEGNYGDATPSEAATTPVSSRPATVSQQQQHQHALPHQQQQDAHAAAPPGISNESSSTSTAGGASSRSGGPHAAGKEQREEPSGTPRSGRKRNAGGPGAALLPSLSGSTNSNRPGSVSSGTLQQHHHHRQQQQQQQQKIRMHGSPRGAPNTAERTSSSGTAATPTGTPNKGRATAGGQPKPSPLGTPTQATPVARALLSSPPTSSPFPDTGLGITTNEEREGTPGSEEPPFNLELLLPYATLSQVRFFVIATDKYGCTPVDTAAAAGHIHLAHLLHKFMASAARGGK